MRDPEAGDNAASPVNTGPGICGLDMTRAGATKAFSEEISEWKNSPPAHRLGPVEARPCNDGKAGRTSLALPGIYRSFGSAIIAGSGGLLGTGREPIREASGIGPQVEQCLNLDPLGTDPEKHPVGEAANKGTADLRQDDRERFRALQNAAQRLFNTQHQTVPQTRPDAVVPCDCPSQIGFGPGRNNQKPGHFGWVRRRFTSSQEE